MDAATFHLERPLALEEAHVVVDGLHDHGRSLAARRRDDLAREGSDEQKRGHPYSDGKQGADPELSRPRRPRRRPARGQLSLEGDGRRVLGRAPLESARQLPVDEAGVGAVGAIVEMAAQDGHEIRSEAAVLIVQELIARIGAVHG